MEIVKLKNTRTRIKNSLDGLKTRAEIIQDQSSKFVGKLIDCIQSEQRENRMGKKKMDQALETCEKWQDIQHLEDSQKES